MLLMGKSTIKFLWPFSIAMLVYRRVLFPSIFSHDFWMLQFPSGAPGAPLGSGLRFLRGSVAQQPAGAAGHPRRSTE